MIHLVRLVVTGREETFLRRLSGDDLCGSCRPPYTLAKAKQQDHPYRRAGSRLGLTSDRPLTFGGKVVHHHRHAPSGSLRFERFLSCTSKLFVGKIGSAPAPMLDARLGLLFLHRRHALRPNHNRCDCCDFGTHACDVLRYRKTLRRNTTEEDTQNWHLLIVFSSRNTSGKKPRRAPRVDCSIVGASCPVWIGRWLSRTGGGVD